MFSNLKDNKQHTFWDTQPVINTLNKKCNNNNLVNGPIKNIQNMIQQETKLPSQFYWTFIDIYNDEELNNIYTYLINHYHEYNDTITFKYSKEILTWYLQKSNNKNFILAIKIKKSNKIIGLITMIPITLKIYDKIVNSGIINFLCVHKEFRKQNLVPLLITEITRLATTNNIYQALYTSGHLLINPISNCTYYHRPINIKKLIEINFIALNKNVTNKMMYKIYKIPESKFNKKIRKMNLMDLDIVFQLYTNYISKFKIHPIFTQEEFNNWFSNNNQIIYSYVLTNNNDIPTDFFSFFKITSNLTGQFKYDTIDIAYPSCIIANTIKPNELMNEMLFVIEKNNFDVLSCLNIMDNQLFIKECKFLPGTGFLNYHLYNWQCPIIESNMIGFMLI